MDYLNLRKDLQSDSLSSHLKSANGNANNINDDNRGHHRASSIAKKDDAEVGEVGDLTNSSFGEKLAHFQETDRKNSLMKTFAPSSGDRDVIPYVKPSTPFEREDLFDDAASEDYYGSLTRRGGPGKHQSMSSLMPAAAAAKSAALSDASKEKSKHFQSLQIFTSHAEPCLDEFMSRKEQIELETKHRDEEDKLYRKFLANRREEEEHIKHMGEEERDVYLLQLTREERSKIVKLTEKHCKQMLDLIYKKKIDYFSQGGDEDWKSILARSYPREPPEVAPPVYNKEQVYENNYDVFEEVDATAVRIARDEYKLFTNLVRDLIDGYTSDVEKARVIFRYITERKFAYEVWFLYYPEEANKRGAPVQLFRGVEFGLETKALLFKRLCAYAGLHAQVIKGYSKSSGYLPGEEFVDTAYRNSWNAVYVAGGWRLIQANWGMLSVNNKVARETRQIYQDHYFLTDPDKFIFEFYPVDGAWQLMEQPISLAEFEDLPLLRSTFFHYGLGLEGSAASVIQTDENGESRISVLAPAEVGFHYELSFFKSGNTAVSCLITVDYA